MAKSMLALISPAKTLDYAPTPHAAKATRPAFLDETAILVERARKLRRKDLSELMGISANLADLSHQRFETFQIDEAPRGAKSSVFAFKGDTYQGLDALTLDDGDLTFAQDHLRILSGLYGLLRPLDEIQPYRLEMGTKLKNKRGKDLYDFWGTALTEAVNDTGTDVVVNLASKEYFSAIKPKALDARVITPVFKEVKGGKARILGLFAKRARGMMARYMLKNRLVDPEGLKGFDDGGYKFQPDLSDDDNLVFQRPQPPANR